MSNHYASLDFILQILSQLMSYIYINLVNVFVLFTAEHTDGESQSSVGISDTVAHLHVYSQRNIYLLKHNCSHGRKRKKIHTGEYI